MWQSLYFYSDNSTDPETLERNLETMLRQAGYERYYPFELFPTKTYMQRVRLFIAPEDAGWIRILGDVDEQLAGTVSQQGFTLLCILEEARLDVSAWQAGQKLDLNDSLQAYRQADCTSEDLHRAIQRIYEPFMLGKRKDDILPMDALSEDMQQAAAGIGNWRKKLVFNQLMKLVNKQFSGDEQAARDLLKSREPDWNSELGQRLTSLMDCLTIPTGWREPSFGTLSDAYQLHVHHRNSAKMVTLPGDDDVLKSVPNALEYIPVYAGRD